MPRDLGTGIYTYPDGTRGNPGQTIFSARYNTFLDDLKGALNQKLPVNMGGTGGDTPATARDSIDAEVAMQTVTNYDTHAWETGSFKSAAGAIGAPGASDPFIGTVQVSDANNIVVEARNLTTSIMYMRKKVLGTWGGWGVDSGQNAFVLKTGDTMSGALTVTPKGSMFGTHGGTLATGAVTSADANIKLYDQGSGNWAGIGADTSGNMWFKVGTSGTPVPALMLEAAGPFIKAQSKFFTTPCIDVVSNASSSAMQINSSGASTHALINFLIPTVFNANFGLGIDGNFYMGGGTYGAVAHKFWTAREGVFGLPGASGYQKLPSGLILQFGSVSQAAPDTLINYPIVFPNNVLSLAASINQAPGASLLYGLGATMPTTGYFVPCARYINGAGGVPTPWAAPITYIAIGY